MRAAQPPHVPPMPQGLHWSRVRVAREGTFFRAVHAPTGRAAEILYPGLRGVPSAPLVRRRITLALIRLVAARPEAASPATVERA